jgi:hypothetical protein
MLAFNGTPSIDMETAHADGDKSNVRLSNLRYATRQENEKDKLLHGTHNRGARHGMSKLTEQDVLTIRQVIGQTQTALAKRFGVSDSCIRAILSRQRWAWL